MRFQFLIIFILLKYTTFVDLYEATITNSYYKMYHLKSKIFVDLFDSIYFITN